MKIGSGRLQLRSRGGPVEPLSAEHRPRLTQLPRLAWVLARAYAFGSTTPVQLVFAIWSLPAYLLLVVNAWGAGTLLARADGRAMFTATPVTASGRRREWGLAILPLMVLYLIAMNIVSSEVSRLVDGTWPSVLVESGTVIVLGLLMLLPTRPWAMARNRVAKSANRAAQSETPGPHWELDAFAAWPHGQGYGMQLLNDVIRAGQGTGWLVARDDWLVGLYEGVGCEVVPGSGGRGMRVRLGGQTYSRIRGRT